VIDATSRAVAQIKLRELHRQRDLLHEHYAALEKDAATAPDLRRRLDVLYQGLRTAKFAQQSLHPEVANLEALFLEAEQGAASPEQLRQCLDRLEREVAQGRLRADFSSLFGHLVEEWLAALDAPPRPAAAGNHPFDEKLQLFLTPPERPLDLSVLQAVFDRHRPLFEAVRASVRACAEKEALATVTTDLVRGILKILGNDITRAPDVRRQALESANDPLLVNEMAGALTVLVNNLDDWDWPAEGFPLRPLWSRTKWRPYLDEDLLTLLFQSLVGLRWGVLLRQLFNQYFNHPQNPIGAPGAFRQENHPPAYDPLDWARTTQWGKLFLPMIPPNLEQLGKRDSYGGYEARSPTPEGVDPFQELLLLVNAEIRLAQATRPGEPLWVVQTDLRDFYLRIPHEALLYLVENLGFPPRWLAFFRRFLAVRVRHGGERRPVCRGVMLDHVLSDVLAEYLLLFLDLHVYAAAEIRLLRVVDDIFFVADNRERAARAWQAIGQFCGALGLEVNEAKTGSICLAGGLAPELPPGRPRWGMLGLTAEGGWELDREGWQDFQASVRRQLGRPMPVLTMIAVYNGLLNYVLKFLGVRVPLGEAHRRQIAEAMVHMHHHLFGPGHGIMAEARRRWEGGAARVGDIPEALFYLPQTAGGLGLFNPACALVAYHDSALAWRPPPRQADLWGESFGNKWAGYFQAYLQPLPGQPPVATPALEGLLDDFASRSGEVAGRTRGKAAAEKKRRTQLGVYWQWVIYTYGPQVLTTLGTFRFLITELVPLQLIVQNRLDASSLTGEIDAGPTPPPGARPSAV
jgi:hypothetical protein